MKNISFYILVILIISMASCKKDNQNEYYDLGTEFLISNNGISSLDTEVTFTIDNYKNNLTEVVMVDQGTITITDSVGTINLTSADLGITEAGKSASFTFNATFNGKAIQRFAGVTISNPMSLTSPYIWKLNDDDPPVLVETPVTVYQNDGVQYIKYAISPVRASVESIKIETKVGKEGTYTEVSGSFNPAFDSLAVVGSDYVPNDVVYYRFTAKNGSHEQVGELSFVVNTIVFPNTGGAHLGVINDTTTQGFDLASNKVVAVGTDTTDFEMVHTILTSVGFESNNGTLFVATDEATYDANDIVAAKALFDAGTQESGFTSISTGDYFIYKNSRGDYGIINITAVYLTTDGTGDYFDFEYIY